MKVELHPKRVAAFPKKFRRAHWEKKPALLSRFFEPALLSPSEAWAGALQAAERYRAGQESGISFYVEQSELTSDLSKYLPAARDRNFKTYYTRVRRSMNGRSFALVIREIQMHSVPVWDAFREFLQSFYATSKVPLVEARATLFFGDYPKTPFGLHQGTSGNFKFVLEGHKRMFLWPGRFFKSRFREADHTLNFERYRASATVLDGRQGDIIYWPSDHWHIGANLNGPALDISLALFVQDPPSLDADLRNQTARMIERTSILPKTTTRPRPREIVGALGRATRMLEREMAPKIVDALMAKHLNRASAVGFRDVPPVDGGAIMGPNSIVQGSSRFPVLCSRNGQGELICSANGHSFAVPFHSGIEKLVQRLNRGRPENVSNLLGDYSRKKPAGKRPSFMKTDVIVFLRKCLQLRAIKLIPPVTGKRRGRNS